MMAFVFFNNSFFVFAFLDPQRSAQTIFKATVVKI